MNVLSEALLDTIKDTATLAPFLFLTYLAMEWLEGRTEEQSVALLSRMGRSGPVIGAAIGLIPQCGFSAAAAGLYSGGLITLGAMLSVFLSTSDEMLPIFISSAVNPLTIAKILLAKFIIACISGYLADAAIGIFKIRTGESKHIHDICEQDNCGCEEDGGIVRSAAIHTIKTLIFIFIASFIISLVVGFAGKDSVAAVLGNAPLAGTFLMGLVGLIPNCAASVIVAELYIEGIITSGQMLAGLLVGAGVGMLVLIRNNKRASENIKIIALLYATGVFWGLLIDFIGLKF